MIRFASILLISLLISSCGFGVGLKTNNNVTYSKPFFHLNQFNKGEVREDYNFNPPWRYSKEEVSRIWGKPNTVKSLAGNTQLWEYCQPGYSWGGVIIGIGLPIPLFLPTGSNCSVLTFNKHTLVSVDTTKSNFHFCGYFISSESAGWGC